MIIFENEPMSHHTSFKVGGPARYFAKVETCQELKEALDLAKETKLPYFILGNGTNLLVADKGFHGVVITLAGEFSTIEDKGEGLFKVGAAVPLGRFARTTLKAGYTGIHKLAGIPGTLGGALYMNAGAYGQEIGDVCVEVQTVDGSGRLRTRAAAECDFSYRHSIFQTLAKVPSSNNCGKNSEIILSANFKIKSIYNSIQNSNTADSTVADLEAELQECMAKRKATQPLNMPNAGSTFKRLEAGSKETPKQIAPGYYIEQAGLKGFRLGGAEVSMVHANFIVNAGGATAQDICDLSLYVQQVVQQKFGIQLQREIILLGEF